MSLNRGQTVRFKINVQSGASYTLRIYRIGYYGGNGARLMANLGTLSGTVQPNGISNSSTGHLRLQQLERICQLGHSFDQPYPVFILQSWKEQGEEAIILRL